MGTVQAVISCMVGIDDSPQSGCSNLLRPTKIAINVEVM